MNYIKYILSSLILLNIIGCSSESSYDAASLSKRKEASVEAEQRNRSEYLAYEHRITIDLPKDDIGKIFEEIISFCADDTTNKCTIIHSSINTGDYSSSNIQARVLPAGVEPLLSLASGQGNILNKSTDVEDLQDAIVNGSKRLEMLLQYQSRLIELEKESTSDIESLIKIAQELSKVQSNIEYAQGEKAKLLQRTQMDIVHISLRSRSYVSFWGPISGSLADFGENLSEGISQAIITVAYLLPWVLIVLFLLYVLRIVWRKTRAKE
ncbi:DUF4349 domain-containing protein [Arenicella xantha]|uniref:Uncharacterized protein DUF4349 n=1 Tax=Arenicella xantha TaxID=644221 RepID=A0A395JHC2_9GAMM|nr:DUF4349 domain-containing protein [Arenicella xantha]RBP49360.1 uncharacterized protein DUF4349 [Arenicella xantha]